METTLVAVTLSSLVVAGLMGIVLVRMLREERRRSDARVAMLQELASSAAAAGGEAADKRAPLRLLIAESRLEQPTTQILDAFEREDLDLRPDGDRLSSEAYQSSGAPALFAAPAADSPWRRRIAVAAALAVLVAGLGGAWRWSRSDATDQRSAVNAASPQRPLELATMTHAYENDVLTITGVVVNPSASATINDLEVTGVVFDGAGVQVASGRAPVDLRILSAGIESPFVLRIPVSGSVARYRVGFRTRDDQVVAHVDRRNRASLARKQAP